MPFECSKTPGQRSEAPPVLSALWAPASALQASPVGIHHLLLSNLTTAHRVHFLVVFEPRDARRGTGPYSALERHRSTFCDLLKHAQSLFELRTCRRRRRHLTDDGR